MNALEGGVGCGFDGVIAFESSSRGAHAATSKKRSTRESRMRASLSAFEDFRGRGRRSTANRSSRTTSSRAGSSTDGDSIGYESIVIDVTFVVPCYNEEKRLDLPRFSELARGAHLIFVDDGSTDRTRAVLDGFAKSVGSAVEVLSLEKNSGKAEAVRRGMLFAAERGDRIVGFADADLATPPREILRIGRTVDEENVQVVLGARVALIGKRIERNPARHYIGRVFATIATTIIRAPFYDTQCGAKAFLNTPSFRAALGEPFLTRWIFDLEIIGRLLIGSESAPPVPISAFYELPLEEWVDVRGSKIGLDMAARVWIDLGRIAADMQIRREKAKRSPKG